MCGRFTITLDLDDFREELGLAEAPVDWLPRFNVAPSQQVAVVTDAASRQVSWMKWGLVPAWAPDASIGSRMINARAETVAEKPSFKQALSRRRCLVLADGFYEWQKLAGKQATAQPFYFTRNNHRPFAFAGLWEIWQPPQAAEPLLSCTIITCAANELVAPVHERMPVMLDNTRAWEWLSARPQGELLSLLQPYPAEQMTAIPVSTLVNDAGRDAAVLITPIH